MKIQQEQQAIIASYITVAALKGEIDKPKLDVLAGYLELLKDHEKDLSIGAKILTVKIGSVHHLVESIFYSPEDQKLLARLTNVYDNSTELLDVVNDAYELSLHGVRGHGEKPLERDRYLAHRVVDFLLIPDKKDGFYLRDEDHYHVVTSVTGISYGRIIIGISSKGELAAFNLNKIGKFDVSYTEPRKE